MNSSMVNAVLQVMDITDSFSVAQELENKKFLHLGRDLHGTLVASKLGGRQVIAFCFMYFRIRTQSSHLFLHHFSMIPENLTPRPPPYYNPVCNFAVNVRQVLLLVAFSCNCISFFFSSS